MEKDLYEKTTKFIFSKIKDNEVPKDQTKKIRIIIDQYPIYVNYRGAFLSNTRIEGNELIMDVDQKTLLYVSKKQFDE